MRLGVAPDDRTKRSTAAKHERTSSESSSPAFLLPPEPLESAFGVEKLEGANATRESTTSCKEERRTSIAEVACVSEKELRDATIEGEHGESGSGTDARALLLRGVIVFQLALKTSEDKTWSANLLIAGGFGFGGFTLGLFGVMGRSGVLKIDVKWRGVVVDDAGGSSVQYCLRMFKIIRPVAHIVRFETLLIACCLVIELLSTISSTILIASFDQPP